MIRQAKRAGAEGFAGVFLHFLNGSSVDLGVLVVKPDEELVAAEDFALVADGDLVHLGDGIEEVIQPFGQLGSFGFGVVTADGKEFAVTELEEVGAGAELGRGDPEGSGDGTSPDGD